MQNIESVPDQARPPTAVNSSGWQRTAIAVVITALIFGASGYLLGLRTAQNPSQGNQEISLQPSPILTRKPSPSPFVPKTFYPVPTTNPVLTANWKTYTSEKYSFTFRYPPHIYTNTLPCPTYMDNKCQPDYIAFQTHQIPPGKSYEELNLQPTLQYEEVSGGYLKLFITGERQGVFLPDMPVGGYYRYERIVIGGKTGLIFSDYSVLVPTGEKRHERSIEIPLKGKKYVQIAYYGNAITLDEFNQILSTFKFTD